MINDLYLKNMINDNLKTELQLKILVTSQVMFTVYFLIHSVFQFENLTYFDVCVSDHHGDEFPSRVRKF